MKHIIHKANTRGHNNYEWLDTWHTFSFANYYNPERLNFGVLRVLNDDTVIGGAGFGEHPHENMEILTIVLDGALRHKDDMGNTIILKKNDVQVMSAGTGIIHSEYNYNSDLPVKFLQIWIIPREKGITPRYDQINFDPKKRVNVWQSIVSPKKNESLEIKQDAFISMIKLETGKNTKFDLINKAHGIYLFVIDGKIKANEINLERRDGAGFWEIESINITSKSDSEILLLEVPL